VRHLALNDCISRAFGAAGIPVRKEPAGLVQKDGKHPDGCTLIPRRGGRPLAWDVTVCTTVAASYLTAASQSAGAAAEQLAESKSLLNCLQPTNFSQWQLRYMGLRTRLRFLLSLSWRVRSRNTRTTRLTVVTFSSESACSFSDITPFFSVRPSRLKMKSTRSHSSLVLVCLVLNPGDLYYAACASHVAFIYYLAAKGASHLYAGKIKYTYAR